MPYLDVIRRLRDASNLPIAAYQVSGEYAMLKAAAQKVCTLSYMLQFTMYLLFSLDLLFPLIISIIISLFSKYSKAIVMSFYFDLFFHVFIIFDLFVYLFIYSFYVFSFVNIKLVGLESV